MSGRGGLRPARAVGSEAGVALAILVWFLAAMSLLVAGIVMQARVDTKLSGLHLTRARVEAAGDGAIQLALAELLELGGEFSGRSAHYGAHSLGKLEVAVILTPLSGLIDLNTAPEGLLAVLFSSIDGLDESVAYELSASVVKWRAAALEDAGDSPGGRFEVLEDLLMVEGVNRDIFEAVQGSVYVNRLGSPGVDWVSAPLSVLLALGEVDEEAAMGLVESRLTEKLEYLEPPAGMDLSYQQAVESNAYRADALVILDKTVYLRRRWVDRARVGADGLPWLFFRTEAVRVVPGVEGAMLITKEGSYAGD
jgi:general secretion pathway protein K